MALQRQIVEELEKKMEIKIERVRDMMLDRFCGVDQKLVAIEELLRKMMEVQNQNGATAEKMCDLTGENMGGGTQASKSKDKGKNVQEKTGLEGGSKKKKEGKSKDQAADKEAQPFSGWKKDASMAPEGGASAAAVDQNLMAIEVVPSKTMGVQNQVGTAPDKRCNLTENITGGGTEVSKCQDKGKSMQATDRSIEKGQYLAEQIVDRGGGCKKKECWCSPVDQAETPKDSSIGGKAIQNETNCKWVSAAESDEGLGCSAPGAKKDGKKPQVVPEESIEKGHDDSQKPGLSGWKEEGRDSKRKHHDSSVGGPDDSLISSGLLTTSKRRLYMFTNDEQEILSEIETIKQSIREIMHHKGYNDGEPLSAVDQTYILDNVFNHHPEKAQKMGTGLDYVMISKHMEFEGSRCFYIVSTDGGKQDFCYHKCVWNFISVKYHEKLQDIMLKNFKISEPWHPTKMDYGSSGLLGSRTCSSWSGLNRETRVATDEAEPGSSREVEDDGATPA